MTIQEQLKKFTSGDVEGFTLIEFVVIISIFAIIAAISLFNFSGFSSNIGLSNVTHDIALVIRDAQVSGISGISEVGDPTNPVEYGVYFLYDSNNGTFEPSMVLFIDEINVNNMWDQGEEVDIINIQTADRITNIEVGPLSSCPAPVSIMFTRPDPNPAVYCGSNPAETSASIRVTSNDSTQFKIIDIHQTGQINIQ